VRFLRAPKRKAGDPLMDPPACSVRGRPRVSGTGAATRAGRRPGSGASRPRCHCCASRSGSRRRHPNRRHHRPACSSLAASWSASTLQPPGPCWSGRRRRGRRGRRRLFFSLSRRRGRLDFAASHHRATTRGRIRNRPTIGVAQNDSRHAQRVRRVGITRHADVARVEGRAIAIGSVLSSASTSARIPVQVPFS